MTGAIPGVRWPPPVPADPTRSQIVEHSPFTAAYVRKLARENGIEPAKKGKQDG